MSKAVINTRDISFGLVASSATAYNVNYAICKSLRASSAETKCTLPSSLVNFKSLQSISLTAPTALNGYVTDAYLNMDSDYTISGNFLPKNQDKTVHLEGRGYFLLNGNSVIESDLSSAVIPNNNKLEAVIPPSSCFNLTLSEIITTVVVPFVAQGNLRDESTGAVLQSLTITGQMVFDVLDTNYSEVMPCM